MIILPDGRPLIMGTDFLFVLFVAPHLICSKHLNAPLIHTFGMQEHHIDIIRFSLGTCLPAPEPALKLIREIAEAARRPDSKALMMIIDATTITADDSAWNTFFCDAISRAPPIFYGVLVLGIQPHIEPIYRHAGLPWPVEVTLRPGDVVEVPAAGDGIPHRPARPRHPRLSRRRRR